MRNEAYLLVRLNDEGRTATQKSDFFRNHPQTKTLPGGTTRNLSFDSLMRIKKIEVKDPAKPFSWAMTTPLTKKTILPKKTTEHGPYDYAYDNLYRLTSTDNPGTTDEAFTYDAIGNRKTLSGETGLNYNWH